MVILVLNCGSSSIKYQVIDMVSPRENSLLAKGLVERIGIEGGIITHKPTGKPRLELTTDIPNHTKGIDLIFKAITDSESGVIASLDDIRAVGHRVAHGGDFFDRSVLVDDEVINRIEQLVELAPLHNPANLKGIYAVKELCPAIPQVVCFDTSFHQSMPPRSYIYGLPYKYYEQYRVRRYGFHGTSHKFVAQKGCELAGLDFAKAKVVTCHIGNGASVAAVDGGRSIDTSMGFTPVDGLLMGTRCGEVDPGALTYIADKEHMTGNEVWGMINKQAGVLGITGLSSDMRDIENAAAEGNERAKLALDVYYYRVKKYVGSLCSRHGRARPRGVYRRSGRKRPCAARICVQRYGIPRSRIRRRREPRPARQGYDTDETRVACQGGPYRHERGAGHRHRYFRYRRKTPVTVSIRYESVVPRNKFAENFVICGTIGIFGNSLYKPQI